MLISAAASSVQTRESAPGRFPRKTASCVAVSIAMWGFMVERMRSCSSSDNQTNAASSIVSDAHQPGRLVKAEFRRRSGRCDQLQKKLDIRIKDFTIGQ